MDQLHCLIEDYATMIVEHLSQGAQEAPEEGRVEGLELELELELEMAAATLPRQMYNPVEHRQAMDPDPAQVPL
jgi:hypothetical protein